MNPLRFPLLFSVALLACRALATVPAPALISIDQCRGPYLIRPHLEVAAALQALPEETRVATLRAWAGGPYDRFSSYQAYPNDIVIRLCRMLFQGRDGHPLRPPALGGPQFIGFPRSSMQDWAEARRAFPDEPLHWVGDIPFLVVRGYMLAGHAEPAASYLDYCLAEGEWVTRRLGPVSDAQLRRALGELLGYPWKQPLEKHEVDFIGAQLAPNSPPPGIDGVSTGTPTAEGRTYAACSLNRMLKRPVALGDEDESPRVAHALPAAP